MIRNSGGNFDRNHFLVPMICKWEQWMCYLQVTTDDNDPFI